MPRTHSFTRTSPSVHLATSDASHGAFIVVAMSPPRYLFTARVAPAGAGQRPHIAWRLVGGNNHELGRSAIGFPDFESCVAAVREMKRRLGDAEPEVTSSGAQWGWTLLIDEAAVAVSCRWYRRPRESQFNLLQFMTVAPNAALSDVLGTPPPRRNLLRPEFVVPHAVPVPVDPDGALVQDLPVDLVEELDDADAASTQPVTEAAQHVKETVQPAKETTRHVADPTRRMTEAS